MKDMWQSGQISWQPILAVARVMQRLKQIIIRENHLGYLKMLNDKKAYFGIHSIEVNSPAMYLIQNSDLENQRL